MNLIIDIKEVPEVDKSHPPKQSDEVQAERLTIKSQ